MSKTTASVPHAPLRGSELLFAAAAVTVAYSSVLLFLHRQVVLEASADAQAAAPAGNYWGTLPSAWDHPEPNYLVSPAIGEFWSVLTTIPIAGSLLMYEGIRYGYGWKVLRIYALTCCMYTLAFSAHLTLQRNVFSVTVTAVMSNALLTFAQFSSVAHRMLHSAWVRGVVVLVAEVVLILTVAIMPYALPENGGVWTLFTVQSPGVFLATAISAALSRTAVLHNERVTFKTVSVAGALLSSAMVLSLFECLYGFEYGIADSLWGFPWLHIAIHTFEQIGIYVFGVGVAALHEMLFLDRPRRGAEVRYVARIVPYLYCPGASGELPPRASTTSVEEVRGRCPQQRVVTASTPQATEVQSRAKGADGKTTTHTAHTVRRRDLTPGVVPTAAKC
mmetsp:Transcript_44252/g.127950  ORF Transcript_44252/g.127950 Transcript_44252/m.127950 type:complete len:391 (+) Transcript_44252:124-1296(+)